MQNTELNSHPSNIKLAQALELLNEAAKEKKDEIKALLTNRYTHIKAALTENAEHVIQKAEEFAQEGRENLQKAAVATDKRVRENPWAYIGGAALVSVLLGYLLGSRRK